MPVEWNGNRLWEPVIEVRVAYDEWATNGRTSREELSEQEGPVRTEQEGGTMPETGSNVATIEVLPTYQAQREIFDRLGITEGLIGSLDIENWSRHLEALRQGYTAATFNVERGSYTIEGFPVASVSGRDIRLGSVTADTANTIVQEASGGRISLEPLYEEETSFRLRTVSAIEDAAFEAAYGMSILYADRDPSGSAAIPVTGLSEVMRVYRDFRSNGRRREQLRAAIKNNLLKSVHEQTPQKKIVEWTVERSHKFGEYFENIKKGLVVTENPFANIDLLPHGVKSSRFWGIEPEVVDAGGVDTPKMWERKGDGSLRGLQYESIPSYSGPRPGTEGAAPRSDHDDGCAARNLEEGCTCGECFFPCDCGFADEQIMVGESTQTAEWNSPILRSYHSRGLEYLCEKIEYRNTNSTAGIHVHVDAGDLTPSQVVQVGLMYSALEPLFRAEYKRTVREYCKELDVAEIVKRFKQAGVTKTMSGRVNVRNVFSSDRYYTVNVAALSSHGTLEFRAMGPRYNYEFLIRWAHFLREIVNMAAADIPHKVWRNVRTFKDLVLIMSKYGKETAVPSWATENFDTTKVVEKLGTETRRAPNMDYIRNVATVFDDYSGDVQFG